MAKCETQPLLSFVIPVYNRASDLDETLASLSQQIGADDEILVIENGPSTDATLDVALAWKRNLPHMRLIRSRAKGVTPASNLGNALATKDIVIQMDSDVSLPQENTIDLVRTLFASDRCDVLGLLEAKGQLATDLIARRQPAANGSDLPDFPAQQKIGQISDQCDIYTGFEKYATAPAGLYEIQSFRSCFMAYRRSILAETGNWDQNYTLMSGPIGFRGETDFLLRCARAGMRIRYTNGAFIWHREGQRHGDQLQRAARKTLGPTVRAHAYMASKNILEQGATVSFTRWLAYQTFVGGFKNPGALQAYYRYGMGGAFSAAANTLRGAIDGWRLKRRTASTADYQEL